MTRGILRALVPICLLMGVALSACDASSGTASATSTPAATAPTGCGAAPGFEHATAASGGAHFSDVGFPSGAVGYSSAGVDASEVNGFQYRAIHLCVAGGSVASVQSFHTTDLSAHGWTLTATYPVGGDLATPCPATVVCYIKNDGVIRFLSLQTPVASSGVTEYAVQLVIQPYAFGGALLSAGDAEDVDPTGPGGGTNDFTWTGTQINASGGAQLASVGALGSLNALVYGDLAGVALTTASIPGSALVPGAGIVVRTSEGHFAKLRIATHSGTDLTFDFVTYAYTF